jgi:hypothetical protein
MDKIYGQKKYTLGQKKDSFGQKKIKYMDKKNMLLDKKKEAWLYIIRLQNRKHINIIINQRFMYFQR